MDTQKHGSKEKLSIKKGYSLFTCKLVIRKKLEQSKLKSPTTV